MRIANLSVRIASALAILVAMTGTTANATVIFTDNFFSSTANDNNINAEIGARTGGTATGGPGIGKPNTGGPGICGPTKFIPTGTGGPGIGGPGTGAPGTLNGNTILLVGDSDIDCVGGPAIGGPGTGGPGC